MNLHSYTQTPSTLSFLFYSYSIEAKWENGRGTWGRQMHPNLYAVVIKLRLLSILPGIMVYFFHMGSNTLLCNGMHGMVTMVIEVDQKKILDWGQFGCLREGQFSWRKQ